MTVLPEVIKVSVPSTNLPDIIKVDNSIYKVVK